MCVGGEGAGNAMECKATISFIYNKEASSVNPDCSFVFCCDTETKNFDFIYLPGLVHACTPMYTTLLNL